MQSHRFARWGWKRGRGQCIKSVSFPFKPPESKMRRFFRARFCTWIWSREPKRHYIYPAEPHKLLAGELILPRGFAGFQPSVWLHHKKQRWSWRSDLGQFADLDNSKRLQGQGYVSAVLLRHASVCKLYAGCHWLLLFWGVLRPPFFRPQSFVTDWRQKAGHRLKAQRWYVDSLWIAFATSSCFHCLTSRFSRRMARRWRKDNETEVQKLKDVICPFKSSSKQGTNQQVPLWSQNWSNTCGTVAS